MTFVAFLRGINVGGNVLIKMKDLKEIFESLGFSDVKTVLSSGNVIFESQKDDIESITPKIEKALKKKYKREIAVMLRSMKDLQIMERSSPFKGLDVTPTTRMYVTFLYEPSRGVKLPKEDLGFRIMRIRDMDVFTSFELTPEADTPKAMAMLAKILGPNTTMRNWNTIQKILSAEATK